MLNDLDQYNRKIREDLLIEHDGLRFHTTWGLFSPRAVDEGSRLLLDYLELEGDAARGQGFRRGRLQRKESQAE